MNKARFEWDENKDAENQEKHGVAFSLAQYAFADPYRVIAEDLAHSESETRHFCFGKVGGHSHRSIYVSRWCYTYFWRWLLAKRKGNL